MGKELIGSYAWRLEAAVWVVKSPRDGDEERCRPRLLLVEHNWNYEYTIDYSVMGYIEYDLGRKYAAKSYEGPPRWMVHHYPKDAATLSESHNETKYYNHKILDRGETSFHVTPLMRRLSIFSN